MQFFLKILNGVANSVHPDETALSEAFWFGSALLAYAILLETLLGKILGHLQYCFFNGLSFSFNPL